MKVLGDNAYFKDAIAFSKLGFNLTKTFFLVNAPLFSDLLIYACFPIRT